MCPPYGRDQIYRLREIISLPRGSQLPISLPVLSIGSSRLPIYSGSISDMYVSPEMLVRLGERAGLHSVARAACHADMTVSLHQDAGDKSVAILPAGTLILDM